MRVLRVPVVVWEDYQRGFTARTVTAPPATAFDASAGDALSQLKAYLEWLVRRGAGVTSASESTLDIEEFEASVWAGYHEQEEFFTLSDPIPFRVAAAVLREEGSTLCSLPMLEVEFRCEPEATLSPLVQHYVQEALTRKTPEELARQLAPRSIRGEWLNIIDKESNAVAPTLLEDLESVAEPLAARTARQRLGHAWRREREVGEVAARLGLPRGNVLLVGESGVGKTTVLAAAVRQLERERKRDARQEDDEEEEAVASGPKAPRFWMTSGARLIAGMQYLGQWEERCERVIRQLGEVSGVLCIENLLELIRVGGSAPNSSVAAFLTPYLESGELRLVAEATPSELDACRRLLPSLTSLFQVVTIDEFDAATARSVLTTLAEMLEQNAKVTLAPATTDTVHRLFRRFLPYQPFPGGSVTFLRKLFRAAKVAGQKSLGIDAAVSAFVRQTGLPEFIVRDEILLENAAVLETFRQRVIGQEAACQAAASLVTTFKAGLNDPHRPLGVHLYCGPTGVGKTELARTLGDYLFGHGEQKQRLVRLDMSEYAGPGAAERLFTQPDGRPSLLIRQARAQPFMVVLLDEIEKASAEVFDALLGLFDEGRLTDRFGRTTTFRSAIIVMTSNLGAHASRAIGFDSDQPPAYDRAALAFFRPEFFNRFDAVVTFQPLTAETVKAVARKELAEIQRREGMERSQLTLTWSEAVVDRLAAVGFDPQYGARPLQRTLERLVITPIAGWLAEFPDARELRLHLDLNAQGEIDVAIQ